MKVHVGIDPGKNGALVAVHPQEGGRDAVLCWDVPLIGIEYDLTAMADLLRAFEGKDVLAVLERPMAMPSQASPATLAQGVGVGIWLGILGALKIPYEMVNPRAWRAVMLVGLPKGAGPIDSQARKRALKQASVLQAQRLAPDYAGLFVGPKGGLLDGRAEAYLMALYPRRRP